MILDLAGALARLAGEDRPLEVEIGCGGGHFAVAQASERSDRQLVACELKSDRCRRTFERARRAGVDNLLVVKARGEELVQQLRPQSIAVIHIYFPDPWPKTRHRRRRLLRWDNLAAMVEALQLAGELRFVTDFADYGLQARILTGLHPQLRTERQSTFDASALSRYGPRLEALGRRIAHLTATRVALRPRDDAERALMDLLAGSAHRQAQQQHQPEQVHRKGQRDRGARQ